MITVINPWHDPTNSQSVTQYKVYGKPCFSHRGVEIYHFEEASYLYVYLGMAITHRAGWSGDGSIIDGILDGTIYSDCKVAQHLRWYGFKNVKTYDEA